MLRAALGLSGELRIGLYIVEWGHLWTTHGHIYQECSFPREIICLILYPSICKKFLSSAYCHLEEVPAAEQPLHLPCGVRWDIL